MGGGTIVPGLNGSQSLPVLVNQVGQLEHQIASLGGGQKLPGVGLEGLTGRIDGDIDILFASGVDRGDLLLVTATVSI